MANPVLDSQKQLLRLIVNTFYSPLHVIIVNQLLAKHPDKLRDTELAQELHLAHKHVREALGELRNDGVVKNEQRKESTGGPAKFTGVWYVDFDYLVKVLKFRYKEALKGINTQQDTAIKLHCTNGNCESKDQLYDVLELLSSCVNGEFLCPTCQSAMKTSDSTISQTRLEEDLKQKFNKQILPIVQLMQEIEHTIKDERQRQLEDAKRGLKSDAAQPSQSSRPQPSVSVTISTSTTETSDTKKLPPLFAPSPLVKSEPGVKSELLQPSPASSRPFVSPFLPQSQPNVFSVGSVASASSSMYPPQFAPASTSSALPESSSAFPPSPSPLHSTTTMPAPVFPSMDPSFFQETTTAAPEEEEEEEEVMVMVAGERLPLSSVTPLDYNRMSHEEYEEYCRLAGA